MHIRKKVAPDLYTRNYFLTDNEGWREYQAGLDDNIHPKFAKALKIANPTKEDTVLDIGCGSLRGGKLFIPYLLPEKYYGVEPYQWLIDDGIKYEVGQDMIDIKKPSFSNTDVFDFSTFDIQFDYLLAQSIFSHASKRQIQLCIEEAGKVMHEDSVFFATFYHSKYEYEGDEWVYPDNVAYHYKTIVDIAKNVGLLTFDVDWHHHGDQRWFALTKNEKLYTKCPIFTRVYSNEKSAYMILPDETLTLQ